MLVKEQLVKATTMQQERTSSSSKRAIASNVQTPPKGLKQ